MKLKIEIELDNDAFQDEHHGPTAGDEIARVLNVVEGNLEGVKRAKLGKFSLPLMDMNGNKVGTAKIVA